MKQHTQTAALDALHRAYFARLLAFAKARTPSTDEAHDVVMEALHLIAPHIEKVAPASRYSYWRRAVFNVLVDGHRRDRRAVMRSIEADEAFAEESGLAAPEFPSLDGPVFERLDSQHLRDTVRCSMMELTPEHREVLVLYYFQEKSVLEISAELNISDGTIKSRLSRARTALERPLKGKLGIQ